MLHRVVDLFGVLLNRAKRLPVVETTDRGSKEQAERTRGGWEGERAEGEGREGGKGMRAKMAERARTGGKRVLVRGELGARRKDMVAEAPGMMRWRLRERWTGVWRQS